MRVFSQAPAHRVAAIRRRVVQVRRQEERLAVPMAQARKEPARGRAARVVQARTLQGAQPEECLPQEAAQALRVGLAARRAEQAVRPEEAPRQAVPVAAGVQVAVP
jgi:hypothetical protein